MILLHNNTIVCSLVDNEIKFKDNFLQTEMKENGLSIPYAAKGHFKGKTVVKLGDSDFIKAFKNPLCNNLLTRPNYRLLEGKEATDFTSRISNPADKQEAQTP